MGLHNLFQKFARLTFLPAFIAKGKLTIRHGQIQKLTQWFPAFFDVHFKETSLIDITPDKLVMLAISFSIKYFLFMACRFRNLILNRKLWL